MAKLIDPDDLVVSSSIGNLGVDGNIFLDTAAKTFTLGAYGVLVAKDGVTGNAIWAKFVDLWTTPTYQPYPFPMNVLDARSGQYIFGQDPGGTFNGWKPANDATRRMIRDAGWDEYSNAGALNREYVGLVALASGFPAGAQFYYQKVSGGASANFTYTDAPNEAIQVFGDASNGNFDSRVYFKLYCREYSYKYDDAILSDVGETGTGPYKVALPIAVSSDLDITDNDANVGTIAPYTSIKIRYFAQAFTRDIDSATGRSFGIVIDVGGAQSGVDGSAPGGGSVLTSAIGGMTVNEFAGGTLTIYEGTDENVSFPIVSNTATTITVTGTLAVGSNLSFTAKKAAPVAATLQEIYTKINYQLRQTGNINQVSGGTTVNGNIAALLLDFVGPTLNAGKFAPTNPAGGGTGVLIQGIADADLNSVIFYDNGGVTREYPYASAGNLNFNSFLTAGATGYFRMYFETLPGASNDYGESGAVTVNDKDGNPIQGTISAGVISFTFDYTNNAQGGRTPNTDADVVVVAGNAGEAKPVVAFATIGASKSISITLTAEKDRAYIP
jgi:hypothetical protein